MNNGEDIHHNSKERLERYCKSIAESKEITEQNKQLILSFYEFCKAQSLSNARLAKTLWQMRNLGQWIGKTSFLVATKEDLVKLVNVFQDKYPDSPFTVSDYKQMLKKFYKHLLGQGKKIPEVVEWIDTKPAGDYKIDPSQIFMEEEILRIITVEYSPGSQWIKARNKVMIALLFDSGVRVGELLAMRIGDIKINSDLWHITVKGKTGQRTFPIFPSIPYLKDYLAVHPRKDDKDAPLWCSQYDPGKAISYEKTSQILKMAVKRAGINKPSNPHNFRHSAVTRDASFMSDQELKKKYGWTRSSTQLDTYSHIHLDDLNDSYRRHYNLVDTKIETIMLPKLCPYCHAENKPHEMFCSSCKRPLNIKDVMEEQEKEKVLDEFIVEMLLKMADRDPQTMVMARELAKKKGLDKWLK